LETLKENVPTPNYHDLINLLEGITKTSNGFERKEEPVISAFNKSQSHTS
jgi:hypothetical protein